MIKFTRMQYMQIYSKVYNLCIQQIEGFQAELYTRYTKSIAEYLEKEVKPRLDQLEGKALLSELDLRWKNH